MRKRKHARPWLTGFLGEAVAARNRGARGAADERAVWLYGGHAVGAALRNPKRAHLKLLVTRNALSRLPPSPPLSPQVVDANALARALPPQAVHQGMALLTRPLKPESLENACAPRAGKANHVVLLDRVTDPHNVGAILRSAAAFGARAVVVTERRAAAESGALAKAASGALELVPLVVVPNLAQALERLARMGYWRLGLDETAEAVLSPREAGARRGRGRAQAADARTLR
jgi:23S rRNA (guanosine2251-2'-O)-methyltransferase